MRLEAANVFGFKRVALDLNPGVRAVVGANGAGKTSLVALPTILRAAIEKDLVEVMQAKGGVGQVRRYQAGDEAEAFIAARQGDVEWRIRLHAHVVDDALWVAGQPLSVGRRTMTGYGLANRLALAGLHDDSPTAVLVRQLRDYRCYAPYDTVALRRGGSPASSDLALSSDGANAFAVLRNWRDRRDWSGRFDFVMSTMQRALPWFDDVDFEALSQVVGVTIHERGVNRPIQLYQAPDGWLLLLLHLMAVASAPDGGTVAIDEVENGLHPHALRTFIAAAREYCADHDVGLFLTTHSPAVLNEFDEEPENVLVVTRDAEEAQPRPLSELHDKDWLAHFSLGVLFLRQEYARQEPTS